MEKDKFKMLDFDLFEKFILLHLSIDFIVAKCDFDHTQEGGGYCLLVFFFFFKPGDN